MGEGEGNGEACWLWPLRHQIMILAMRHLIMILQEAKPFPRVSANTLSGTKVEFPQQLRGHVSLVTVSLRAIGMVCDWTPSRTLLPFTYFISEC